MSTTVSNIRVYGTAIGADEPYVDVTVDGFGPERNDGRTTITLAEQGGDRSWATDPRTLDDLFEQDLAIEVPDNPTTTVWDAVDTAATQKSALPDDETLPTEASQTMFRLAARIDG